MKKMVLALSLALAANAYADGWTTSTVQDVGVIYGNGCITLSNSQIVLVDLTSAQGKAEYAAAIYASASGKQLSVFQQTTSAAPVGGCNTGTTIWQHSILKVVN